MFTVATSNYELLKTSLGFKKCFIAKIPQLVP